MQILLVDDDAAMLRYLATLLETGGHQVQTATDGEAAVRKLQDGIRPAVVLFDLTMPETDGLETLARIRGIDPQIKVVMLSSVTSTRAVSQAIRCGAHDYLAKPFDKRELDAVLREIAPPADGREAPVVESVEELVDGTCFILADDSMRQVRQQASLVANVDVPVFLLGESGVGKEVIARFIHHHSQRARRPFLKVNCAALPGELLESELFGYEAGAFTGAERPKPGKFELCGQGTILLDEIGEMSPGLQAKLLHVLQDGTFSRLGGRASLKCEARVLAATNVDVREAMAAKALREDLYYRLSAFTIKVPPLRERCNEIPVLMRRYMGRLAQEFGRPPVPLSPQMQELAKRYPWPGNVRELINVVKRLLILGDEALVMSELEAHLPKNSIAVSTPPNCRTKAMRARSGGLKATVRSLKHEAEMAAIREALRETGGNRKAAANLLNLSYKALLYKVRQYGIRIEPERPPAPAGD